MKHLIAVLLTAVLVVGCSFSGGGGGAETPEGRIERKRIAEFDGRVLDLEVEAHDGTIIRLNTARDTEDTRSYDPDMPNHSGRSWTLLNTASDSTTLAYALLAWDNEDSSDYLLAGWWLHFPGQHPPRLRLSLAENGLFIGGPEFGASDTFRMPVRGEATYSGGAGGLYIYEHGGNWGDLEGTEATEEYSATLTLTADFENRTVRGCLGCAGDINVERTHLRTILGRRPSDDLRAAPTDYELHFAPAPFTRDGDFEQAEVRVTHPERNVVGAVGFWGGSFSNKPDADGNPRLVMGFTQSLFAEDDGSRGLFLGLFNALSDTYRASGNSQGP
ncbi:MAG: hypothetical protein OXL41_03760 [Nitrospinae bacterium]|nr:hypothetical protein [Nitrospinota bacterium]